MAELTPNYALKKPNTDGLENADLRIFVGDNMDILDAELAKKVEKDETTNKIIPTDLPTATGMVQGAITVGNGLKIEGAYLQPRLGKGLQIDAVDGMSITVKTGTNLSFDPTTGALNATGGGGSSVDANTVSSFSASSNVSQTIGAGGVIKVICGLEQYDNLGEYNPTLGRFTASTNGVYVFSGCMRVGNTISSQFFLAFYKNGVADSRVQQFQNGSGNTPAQAHGNSIMKLNAGDYVEIYGYSSVATATTGRESLSFDTTFFRGVKIA